MSPVTKIPWTASLRITGLSPGQGNCDYRQDTKLSQCFFSPWSKNEFWQIVGWGNLTECYEAACVGKVKGLHLWPIRPCLRSMTTTRSTFTPPRWDASIVHCTAIPSITFTTTHLYTWVEKGTVKVKCLAKEHNTMTPAGAQTQTTRSRVQRTKH